MPEHKSKRPWWVRALVWALVVAAVAAGVKYGKKLVFVDNFGVVEEGRVYRSGQMMPYQLERLIRTHGIRTVINTREEDAPAWLMKGEEDACRRNGARMVRIPMPGDGKGTYEQYDQAFAVLSDPGAGPVLVHCARGAYRTGAIVAVYRVRAQGWEEGKAVEEMERYRAHPERHDLLPYLREYFRQRRPQAFKAGDLLPFPLGVLLTA